MKTIIAGSRCIRDYTLVEAAVTASGFTITQVVSGGANGVDMLGLDWARKHGVPFKLFQPDWSKHGRSAGIIRNHEMGDYADALVAIWNGSSNGTRDMIAYARKRGLKVYVHTIAP